MTVEESTQFRFSFVPDYRFAFVSIFVLEFRFVFVSDSGSDVILELGSGIVGL